MLRQGLARTEELPSKWITQQETTAVTATPSSCWLSNANAGLTACKLNTEEKRTRIWVCASVCEHLFQDALSYMVKNHLTKLGSTCTPARNNCIYKAFIFTLMLLHEN